MKLKLGILLGLLLCLFACIKGNDDCDPDTYCDTLPYDSGWVDVEVSFDGVHGVPIVLYEGYKEDNNVISRDTAWAETYYYYLPIETRYAVEAYYNEANQIVIALDGARLKESSFYNCGDKCYNEPELDLNVKKL